MLLAISCPNGSPARASWQRQRGKAIFDRNPRWPPGTSPGNGNSPNQIPRCKQWGIKLATLQSRKCPSDTLVFDPRGIRQLAVQARPLDSLLAGIKRPYAPWNPIHCLRQICSFKTRYL